MLVLFTSKIYQNLYIYIIKKCPPGYCQSASSLMATHADDVQLHIVATNESKSGQQLK